LPRDFIFNGFRRQSPFPVALASGSAPSPGTLNTFRLSSEGSAASRCALAIYSRHDSAHIWPTVSLACSSLAARHSLNSAHLLRATLTKQSYQHSHSPIRTGERNLLTTARSNFAATCVAAPFHPRFTCQTSFSDCDNSHSRNLWPFLFRLAQCRHYLPFDI
jgi:hypothetical protein